MMSRRNAERLARKGLSAHRAGQLQFAVACYERVLQAYPASPPVLHYAALAGRQLNQWARANGRPTNDDAVMRLMALSCAAAPNNAGAVHNFGKFKHDRGELADARQLYENAVAIDPNQGESWTNLGNVYGEMGNRMRAEACWNRALECPNASDDAIFNLSFLKLLRGQYAEGWADYEARWRCPDFVHGYGRPDLRALRWSGAPGDLVLYLHGEQGVGDAIMMARYLPLIRERVRDVIVEVISGLVSLFQTTFPDLTIVARGSHAVPQHDVQLPMLSLPAVFGTTLADIPHPAPFQAGIGSIAPESGRIGLCWRGSTTHVNDRVRSMPFEATFPLLDLPGLAWQSLQFGFETSAPLDTCPLGDFLDTALAIARCEIVITVDTSVAHLAASMGVETWILLPFAAEWRWLQDRDDSPWYPSAKLCRQTRAGDWDGLIRRVASALRRRFGGEAAALSDYEEAERIAARGEAVRQVTGVTREQMDAVLVEIGWMEPDAITPPSEGDAQ